MENKFEWGKPKKDGSGKGMRLNKGRKGCKILEKEGKGKYKDRDFGKDLKRMAVLGGGAILLSEGLEALS